MSVSLLEGNLSTRLEPQISVQKNQKGNKTTYYPQIEGRKVLELKIEMSLNVTSAKWLGKAILCTRCCKYIFYTPMKYNIVYFVLLAHA